MDGLELAAERDAPLVQAGVGQERDHHVEGTVRGVLPAAGREDPGEPGVFEQHPGGEPPGRHLGLQILLPGETPSPSDRPIREVRRLDPLLTASRAAATIQKGEGEAEAVLRKLCGRGIAEARGASSRKAFRLSEAAGRQLGDRSDVREGRIVSIRHDELVRRHVEKHGSISRREAAELCVLTTPQAYRLLKKMESDGILRRVGATGRGARYEGSA